MSLRLRIPLAAGLALATVPLATLSVSADFAERDWQYFKELALPEEPGPQELYELLVPPQVFGGGSPGLADLRLLEAEGLREVPYQLLVGQAQERRVSFPVALRDVGRVPGEHTTFTADLRQEGALHNEIQLFTATKEFAREDFLRRVVVESSRDGERWLEIQPEGLVYRFTDPVRGSVSENTRVSYPESTARFLRVRIEEEEGVPVTVRGAQVFLVERTPAREATYPATLVERQEDTERRLTHLVMDLGTSGVPTDRLTLVTSAVNFQRQVVLEGSDDRETWRVVHFRDTLFAFDTPALVSEKKRFTYPEATARYLRLTILNADDPPLALEGVQVSGTQRRLVFPAEPQRTYRLYYGNPDAQTPSYEFQQFLPYLQAEDLPQAGLGAQLDNSAFVPRREPLCKRFPWLFPTAIGLAAVAVALLLVGVVRQAKGALAPPSEEK